MSRFVILNLKTKFGDFLVAVVAVLLLCQVAFGHPLATSGHVSDVLRVSDEPEPVSVAQPGRSEGEILDAIFRLLVESYRSELSGRGDSERMLGDQPSQQNGGDEQLSQEKARENNHRLMKETAKKERMIQIVNNVFEVIGRPVPTNLPMTIDQTLKDSAQYAMQRKSENVDHFTESTTMYPNCTIPPDIDIDEWYNSSRMNLYFKSRRNAPSGHYVKVTRAILSLYKLPIKLPESNDDRLGGESVGLVQDANQKSDSSSNPVDRDNKTITVQLFYFKKPLKKLKPGEKGVRKVTLETRVLLASKAEKTQWNITAAAQEWQNNSTKNFGITIIVKDEKGKKLPAHSVFGGFDCSKAASLPARLPSEIMEFIRQENKTLYQDYQDKYEKLPALDIATEDIPDYEYDMFDEETNRKVRHERQKKNNKQKSKSHKNSSGESVEE